MNWIDFSSPLLPVIACLVILLGYGGWQWLKLVYLDKKVTYQSLLYWDKRYALSYQKNIKTYDWYTVEAALLRCLEGRLPVDGDAVGLDLGCGQSLLNEELVKKFGSKIGRLVCTDFSAVCIDTRKRANKLPALEFVTDDARRMQFSDETFDFVIEKATFDSTIAPRDAEARARAQQMVSETARVLKNNGWLLSISCEQFGVYSSFLAHPHLQLKEEELVARRVGQVDMNIHIYLFQKII